MIAPLIVATAAFLLFARAMDRQWAGRRRVVALRLAAWGAIALDFALCLHAEGAVFGPIAWIATLMAGAAAIFCLVNFAPRRTARRVVFGQRA